MNKVQPDSDIKETKIEIDPDFIVFKSTQKGNWEKTKHLISKNIKEVVWKAWIDPLNFIEYDKNVLHLSSDSKLISNRAETQYYETIFFEASKYFKELIKIIIHTKDRARTPNSFKIEKNYNLKTNTLIQNDLSFVDTVTMKINTKLTFDNFVVGSTNQMPYAASKRICDISSLSYNPLYIHGNVGMGKTHLLNAIAIDLKQKNPNIKIFFMSAERFMYQFIKAIRQKNTLMFKDQFRSIDVLIIDDIQFIGGKGSTQEEFLYTFNNLIDDGKQIIISSNKSPFELIDLEEKLKSRLGGGLVVDFLPTNYELRLDILRKKVNLSGLNIPLNVLQFLANKIVSNIRELEGALNRIWANHELTGNDISLENSERLLSDILLINEKNISIKSVQEKVALFFNLKLSDMTSSRRSISVARPRQIAMYICKAMTSFSYPEIGKAFGGKDHTTVMHAVKKIESLLLMDKKLKNQLYELKNSIVSIK
ncbi:chromosomal replication initiator protein DnaA [Alphaproteobacteria bacterium]|nr:chromosomal replication initiator protein DnaA [Alphaproteobacteria bacterium]